MKQNVKNIAQKISSVLFTVYATLHTLFNHPEQYKKAYWTDQDTYIIAGITGYVSHGILYDINGDITNITDQEFLENLLSAVRRTRKYSNPDKKDMRLTNMENAILKRIPGK